MPGTDNASAAASIFYGLRKKRDLRFAFFFGSLNKFLLTCFFTTKKPFSLLDFSRSPWLLVASWSLPEIRVKWVFKCVAIKLF
jgi:hypothetical protein